MTKVLTLFGYRIIRVDRNTLVRIYAEALEAPRLCPCCGGDRLHNKDRYERRVRHLPCLGVPSELILDCQRYECLGCSCSLVLRLPRGNAGRRSSEAWCKSMYERHDDGSRTLLGWIFGHLLELPHAKIEATRDMETSLPFSTL